MTFTKWKESKTGKLLIKEGNNEKELKEVYKSLKDFWKDTEVLKELV